MPGASTIRFLLDGEIVELNNVDPTRTVLQYLREDLGRKGSKEGCAEGDCGACTAVLAERRGTDVALQAINSCIQFLPTLDGKQLLTVESLSAPGAALHPVQQAMVDEHGSQCGFCTPGFVMSLLALYESRDTAPDRQTIDDTLAGNLCRCTGYRPIIAAAKAMFDTERHASLVDADLLATLEREQSLDIDYSGRRFFAPRTRTELAGRLAEFPDATILAGGTDVGLWVTKQHRELDVVIYTGAVTELTGIERDGDTLTIGAAATLSDAIPAIVEHYPGLDEMFRRFASPPIRNAGTLGGNIANGSPIGDSMVALMVIGTELELESAAGIRTVPIDAFYHDYQVNELQPGEFVANVRLGLPESGQTVRSHKWSKRFDQDISAVCTAYSLQLEGDKVTDFRMACGGMAATVKRAAKTEDVVNGQRWNDATVAAACAALADDFTPISDMRADAASRLLACQNLLRRFFAETADGTLQTVYTYGR